MFDVTAEKKGDIDYFTALSDACDTKEVQALFLDAMLKHDIQDFHTGNIPETQGLMEQRLES